MILRQTLIYLLITFINILLLGTLIAWPFALFASFFMMDAPDSTSNIITIGLIASIWTYPIPVLWGTITFFFKKNITEKQLLHYTYLGMSGPIVLSIFILMLNYFCTGHFDCH